MNNINYIFLGLCFSAQLWANDSIQLASDIGSDNPDNVEVYNLALTASEEKGGAWIETYHAIYSLINGKVNKAQTAACYSYKNEACTKRIPVGNYLVKSTYDLLQQKTPIEIKANVLNEPLIIMGTTSTVEISTTKNKEGQAVEAHHNIFKISHKAVGNKLPNILASSCYSYKNETCKKKLLAGNYLIKSNYKIYSKETPLVIKAGEDHQVIVLFGQTGSIEIAATESEKNNWVEAYHSLHRIAEDNTNNRRITACYSHRKEACIKEVPVGRYFIRSNYNQMTQDTPFEIKAGVSTLLVSFKG